ncbi:MAG: VOC family protein, partial [Acidimicrobiales bacterium]
MPETTMHRTRIARPTVDLAVSRYFYEQVIGLEVLAEFTAHEGFDGVVFAIGDGVQFELVRDPDHHAPAPTVEDLFVFSLDEATTAEVTRRLTEHGASEV